MDPREEWGEEAARDRDRALGGENQNYSMRERARRSGEESRVCVWTRGLLSKVSKAPVGAWLAFEGGRRSPR